MLIFVVVCRWQLVQLAYEAALQLSPADDAVLQVNIQDATAGHNDFLAFLTLLIDTCSINVIATTTGLHTYVRCLFHILLHSCRLCLAGTPRRGMQAPRGSVDDGRSA
jgi:hypothetical protein